ncbi:S-adenosylmethionine:tRNA ribosyltransferase-isomerase [Flavitalea sp.]|nr:S-adenosylmethionine:tRNA ribosyltransferase-isomerase [Flavitalea sp.]
MKDLSIEDYDYNLPAEKIASHPLAERDLSKLLIYDNGDLTEDVYRNLAAHIPEDSLMVFNNSRVIEARLIFSKPSGGKIEIFCLEPVAECGQVQVALNRTRDVSWTCLIGGASKWKPGQVLHKPFLHGDRGLVLNASFVSRSSEAFVIRFTWDSDELSFAEVLHQTGSMPLPPYIKRAAEISDLTRYQTIYADEAGSVAAPTAGLHFTAGMMTSIKERNIKQAFVSLHVGAGTFKPVKASRMEDHEMHAELIDVDLDSLKHITAFTGKHITAVGTTSMRTIESLYWMGIKVLANPSIKTSELPISQWFAYENGNAVASPSEALSALQKWMLNQHQDRLITKTQLLIGPGYRFRVANALVTNFHQPKSTLLLLVAALAGKNWRKIYDYALNHDYRFLSYGDGCLIRIMSYEL